MEPNGQPFSYKAGQTIDLTYPGLSKPDAAGNRRTFSIANAPGYTSLLIATRARGSALKQALVEAPIGSDLEVDGPYGNFTLPQKPSDVFLFAGGIGVTPFRAMVEDTIERSLDHTLSLIHSNRTPEEAPFLEELIRWGAQSAREMDEAVAAGRRGGHRARSAIAVRDVEPGMAASQVDAGPSGADAVESGHRDARSDRIAAGENPSTMGAATLLAWRRPRFRYIPTMTQAERSARGWNGDRHRVSPEFLAELLPLARNTPHYYVAGPPRFVEGTVESLRAVDVDPDRIRFEEFPGY
ncbi:MAG TPA: FAD-dependent oxidoreductase [Candidatus Eisenbacteria bacterium]|nr:FAD-dependent oxidoreductase [Candidatus Eisenbacteria bacterium]